MIGQQGPTVRIGTSGWHYDGWIGPFYPADMKKKALLTAYGAHFSTTEINNSFYRVPSDKAVEAWREQSPPGFLFAWKASRFITHFKRIKEVRESIDYVIGRMAPLGEKFGPILWQLPPQQKRDPDRLGRFLDDLPRNRLHAVEFRDAGWYECKVLDLLKDSGVSLCISDHAAAPSPWEVTAAHVYLRPHGPGGRYRGNYPDETLGEWARRIDEWSGQGREVFCYFDNDQKSAAPFDAKRLMDFVSARGCRLG